MMLMHPIMAIGDPPVTIVPDMTFVIFAEHDGSRRRPDRPAVIGSRSPAGRQRQHAEWNQHRRQNGAVVLVHGRAPVAMMCGQCARASRKYRDKRAGKMERIGAWN